MTDYAKTTVFGSKRSVRLVAIFLLVLSLGEMAASRPNGEMGELLGLHLDGGIVVSANARSDAPQSINGDDSKGRQSDDSTPLDDDCFWWCPHVLPSYAFIPIFFGVKYPSAHPNGLSVITSPPQLLYRPPRFA
jgi:hypothetical protein